MTLHHPTFLSEKRFDSTLVQKYFFDSNFFRTSINSFIDRISNFHIYIYINVSSPFRSISVSAIVQKIKREREGKKGEKYSLAITTNKDRRSPTRSRTCDLSAAIFYHRPSHFHGREKVDGSLSPPISTTSPSIRQP